MMNPEVVPNASLFLLHVAVGHCRASAARFCLNPS